MASGDVVAEFRECRLTSQDRVEGFSQGVPTPSDNFVLDLTSNLGDGLVEFKRGFDFYPSTVTPLKTYTVKIVED